MSSSLHLRLRQAWFTWNGLVIVLAPLLWYFGFPKSAFLCLTSAHLSGLASTFLPNLSGFGKVYSRFDSPTQDEVWLTIDDGPDPEDTPYLLDLLDRHQAKATFFFIGEKVARHPELVRDVLRRGHQVGNHTHTHPEKRFWAAMPSQIDAEITRCQNAMKEAADTAPTLFRAPVGFKNPWLQHDLEARNLPLIGWSCRGFDGSWKEPQAILQQLYRGLEPGAIILVHESKRDAQGQALCPQVIEPLLQEMKRRKLRGILPEASRWA